MELNIYAAWIGMLLGATTGAIQGLFFHKEDWMGGYGSWQRRMTRLGHIAFFGIAFINMGFASTAHIYEIESELKIASILLVVGQIGMPLICYLSAFIKPIRNLFFIPVLSVVGAIIQLLFTLHNNS